MRAEFIKGMAILITIAVGMAYGTYVDHSPAGAMAGTAVFGVTIMCIAFLIIRRIK